MEILRIILTVIFIVMCIALTVLVLMQEGKDAGLGAIAGGAETYWGKNKGRSMEGMLVKVTRVLVIPAAGDESVKSRIRFGSIAVEHHFITGDIWKIYWKREKN